MLLSFPVLAYPLPFWLKIVFLFTVPSSSQPTITSSGAMGNFSMRLVLLLAATFTHRVQVSWKNTQRVGCGFRVCSPFVDGYGACKACGVLTCQYWPPGKIEAWVGRGRQGGYQCAGWPAWLLREAVRAKDAHCWSIGIHPTNT